MTDFNNLLSIKDDFSLSVPINGKPHLEHLIISVSKLALQFGQVMTVNLGYSLVEVFFLIYIELKTHKNINNPKPNLPDINNNVMPTHDLAQ